MIRSFLGTVWLVIGNLFACRHRWQMLDGAKRHCEKCGAEEWLFTSPYPSSDRPSSAWRRMK